MRGLSIHVTLFNRLFIDFSAAAFKMMNELLSKQGRTITQLARHLLTAKPADRLPAMQHFAQAQAVSVGTVQAAMRYLQDTQVVDIESRGRLGAFVRTLDYPRLWALAYRRPMSGALPMPYSRRVEGLATGLRAAFDTHEFDAELRFIRGAMARIQRLHAQQCDWVVTSRYAAEAARVQGFDIAILLALGPGTYTVDHVLILNGAEALQAGMRIGIDTYSADHAYVVRLLSRGTPVEFVEIDYSSSLEQLQNDEIDAAVWTQADLPVLPPHLHVQRLGERLAGDVQIGGLGEAVIVGLPDAVAVAHVLETALEVDALRSIQTEVLGGGRRAAY